MIKRTKDAMKCHYHLAVTKRSVVNCICVTALQPLISLFMQLLLPALQTLLSVSTGKVCPFRPLFDHLWEL